MPSDKEILREWMRHPGTQLMAHKLRSAAKGILKQYDTCPPDKLVRYQITRNILLNEIPRIIEDIVNKDEPQAKKWNWRKMLGLTN